MWRTCQISVGSAENHSLGNNMTGHVLRHGIFMFGQACAAFEGGGGSALCSSSLTARTMMEVVVRRAPNYIPKTAYLALSKVSAISKHSISEDTCRPC